MEIDLKELVAILKAEREVFVKYLEKLIDQQRYLTKNDLRGIKSSVKQINALSREAIALEDGRRAAIDRISNELRMNPEDISVSQILEKFKGPKFEELKQLNNMILDIYKKVQIQKTHNELLIERSMNIIKETINNIKEVNDPGVAYRGPGLSRRDAPDQGASISGAG